MEVGNVGPDQLLDGRDDIAELDAVTGELPLVRVAGPTVLVDDARGERAAAMSPVSINLETNEVPFQQRGPQAVPIEPPSRDWRATAADVGKWPLIALGLAAVLVAVFALFISRNGQSLSGDELVEPLVASETAVAPESVETDEASEAAAVEPGSSNADGADGRSTGTLGPGEGSGFFSGVVVEPDRSLTGPDVEWTTTTVPAPTTATTASSSTSSPETSVTTESTTTEPTVPPGPWVRAVAPGSPDEANPATVDPDQRVRLMAESSDDDIEYRFMLYVSDDDGDWRLVGRSRWRSRANWTVDLGRFEGRVVRWNVLGRSDEDADIEPSDPLFFRVGAAEEDPGDEETDPPVDVAARNGDFEQGVGGFDTFQNYGNEAIAGWTSSSGVFEVWASGYEGMKAASGSHFLELNATSPTAIVQQVAVNPGTELKWSFEHRSRTGGREAVEVVVRSPLGASVVQFDASGDRWRTREGTYQVPNGVDQIDFSIRSLTGGSVGNFIDDVRIRTTG